MPIPEGFQLVTSTSTDVAGRPLYRPVNMPINTDRQRGPVAFATEFFKGFPSMFLTAGEGIVGVAGMISPSQRLDARLMEMADNIAALRERTFPAPDDAWGWVGRVVGEAVPYMATAAASYGITAVGPFLTAFAVEGGNAYNKAKREGSKEWQATTEGVLVGTINGLIEQLGITKLLKFQATGRASTAALIQSVKQKAWNRAGKDFSLITGDILKSMLTEGIQESMQAGVSIAVPAVISKNFPKNPDGSINWNNILTEIGMNGLGGAIAGGFLTGAQVTMTAAEKGAAPTQNEIRKYREEILNSKIPTARKKRYLADWDAAYGPQVIPTEVPPTEIQLPETIPQPQMNVYRTKDGRIIWDEKELEYRDDKYWFQNQEATPVHELTRGLQESEQDYVNRVTPILQSLQQQIQTVDKEVSEFEKLVPGINAYLDKMIEARPIAEAELAKEKGKRFWEYGNLKEELKGLSPVTRAFIVRSALSGQYAELDIPPLSTVFDETKIQTIFQKANTANLTDVEHLHLTDALDKLFFKGKIPARHDIDALSFIFPRSTVEKLVTLRKKMGKEKFSLLLEGLNVPRALLASFDMSAPLRQGLLMLFRNPKVWFKSVYKGYRAFASPEYASFIDTQIRTHRFFPLAKRSGIILTRVGGLTTGEEMFRSDLAEKLPVMGKVVRASERGYVTVLNALRAYNFYNIAQQWEGKGHEGNDYKQLAAYLNHATGRGNVKTLGRLMPALSAIFFAPRRTIGNVQVLTDLWTKPAVRRLIAADLLSFAGTAIGLLALASLRRGVKVEYDPRSTDFGKVRIGNTRIDFLGGYQQLIRYTAQAVMAQGKSTETGRVSPLERSTVLWRFIQSKLSPAAMATVDVMRGETFLGKQLSTEPEVISREIYERFIPLFLQDLIDVARDRGWDKTSLTGSLLAFHGIGVQTYQKTAGAEVTRLKDFYTQQHLYANWDEVGPDVQQILTEMHPEIKLMEAKAKMERESTSFLAKMVREHDEAARRVTKKLPRGIQDEMQRLLVRIPGLSRYVGNDWYLNEKRYKEYQDKTALLLNKVLPPLMTSSLWNTLPDEARKMILDEMIKEVKDAVRKNIVMQSNMNDIEQLLPQGVQQ